MKPILLILILSVAATFAASPTQIAGKSESTKVWSGTSPVTATLSGSLGDVFFGDGGVIYFKESGTNTTSGWVAVPSYSANGTWAGAHTFSGALYASGANITTISATNITDGTLSDSRLSSAVLTTTGGWTVTGNSAVNATLSAAVFHVGSNGYWSDAKIKVVGNNFLKAEAGGDVNYAIWVLDANGLRTERNASGKASIYVAVAGFGFCVAEGANAKQGVATLSSGVAVVTNSSVTANSRIFLTAQTLGTVTTAQALAITARSAGSSFTIGSASETDTSVVAYEIFEPTP